MRVQLSSLALLSTLLRFPLTSAMWPFPPKRFKGNALLGAGSLGLDTDGRVVALGDFNGDQFLDMVSVGSDQKTLTVHLWNHEQFKYRSSTVLRHNQRIVNVVPGDFTQSGRLDLLVMSQSPSSKDQLDLSLYRAAVGGGLETTPVLLPPSSGSQPIPFDSTGDLRIDLLGISPSSSGDRESFSVWQNVWNVSRPNSAIYELTEPRLEDLQCKPSNPHSHAVVDLDGDCLADLVLVCDDGNTGDKVFQIWINQKNAGFRLQQSGKLPAGTQSLSFADVDRDGTIDMVFATCTSVSKSTGLGNDCYVNVVYNKQLPLCASTTAPSFRNGQRVCRGPEELCIADPNFTFDLSDRPESDAFVRVSIKDLVPTSDGTTPQLLVLDTTYDPSLPVPLKIGDLNLDGFVDIVAIVATPSGDRSKLAKTPKILGSVACGKGVAGCGSDGKGRRGWSVLGRGNNILEEFQDARGVVLVDIDEDGTLDIMVQRTGEQGQGSVWFVQNNFYYDAFFLKAIVLNGGCPSGWCYTANSSRFHPYGVSYSGATYKYTVLDTTGQRAAAAVAQLPQTAYQSLLTPYSFIGLGRTNNYIENFFVGSTKHHEEHFINMEGVVPNSKVVIIPSADDTQRTDWRKELYLRPGEWIPLVTLTVVIATVLLALIVLILHLNEKREDERERRKVSHHINFDAL
ncbi:hypothetical protein BDM02DRAFT_3098371 [Thelephora ganbajun]|uniref:Uncharacterized protein n=1 Tax=Thelephora ganbajun TaxID=370292 RepID=A0ACB6ZBZ2_THEGA|nr:hypothetical protein BDM02DRAFT_3098371 [Thelephora ganbajun]